MSDEKTRKAAYRCVAVAIAEFFRGKDRAAAVEDIGAEVMREVWLIKDAIDKAGNIPELEGANGVAK